MQFYHKACTKNRTKIECISSYFYLCVCCYFNQDCTLDNMSAEASKGVGFKGPIPNFVHEN